MNKREQAEMVKMQEALAIATAGLTSAYPEPVICLVRPSNEYTNGWAVFGDHVDKAWREGHLFGWNRHRVGSRYDSKSPDYNCSASQIGRVLYATERDALIALRQEIETKAKTQLAKIDQLIAKAGE